MIDKFYIIDGDCSEQSPVFINQPLADVLALVDAKDYWLFVKPVGRNEGLAVTSRQAFVEYLRSLKESEDNMEVVCYLHKSGSRLAELDALLS